MGCNNCSLGDIWTSMGANEMAGKKTLLFLFQFNAMGN